MDDLRKKGHPVSSWIGTPDDERSLEWLRAGQISPDIIQSPSISDETHAQALRASECVGFNHVQKASASGIFDLMTKVQYTWYPALVKGPAGAGKTKLITAAASFSPRMFFNQFREGEISNSKSRVVFAAVTKDAVDNAMFAERDKGYLTVRMLRVSSPTEARKSKALDPQCVEWLHSVEYIREAAPDHLPVGWDTRGYQERFAEGTWEHEIRKCLIEWRRVYQRLRDDVAWFAELSERTVEQEATHAVLKEKCVNARKKFDIEIIGAAQFVAGTLMAFDFTNNFRRHGRLWSFLTRHLNAKC